MALGGDLTPEILIHAYRNGIFPWPISDESGVRHLAWFAPPKRAVLFFDELHLSKSTRKLLKESNFNLTINQDPQRVIDGCRRANRGGEKGDGSNTWITDEIVTAYLKLVDLGYCYSFECYDGGQLVGGLYGIKIGRMFAGESMFYQVSGASKLALLAAINFMQKEGGTWLDCQVLTAHMQSFGAKEIERDKFQELLKNATDGF